MTDVTQVCYTTRDIEATALALSKIDGYGPFFLGAFPLSALKYRDESVNYGSIKVGFAYQGNMQIELIEAPAGVPSCYAEVLNERREALHHTYVKTDEHYDAIIVRHAGAGEPLVYHGLAGDDGIRFGFIDARERLGHFIEVLETNRIVGAGLAIYHLYERIKDAARDWNGMRPVREIAELL
jgi:glyoxalase/bleomycin resistance protein/dioxygenase superfamily protein